MLTISWGVRKARIWLNEIPEWSYDATTVDEYIEQVAHRESTHLSSAALELTLPVGGMIRYGGIAVTFTSSLDGNLVIRLPILDGGALYTDSLVRKNDVVYKGFPHEYANGLVSSLIRAESMNLIGPGLLQVCGALHGQVGSSPKMFSVLGRSVLKLLSLYSTAVSEEGLIEIIRTEIQS